MLERIEVDFGFAGAKDTALSEQATASVRLATDLAIDFSFGMTGNTPCLK